MNCTHDKPFYPIFWAIDRPRTDEMPVLVELFPRLEPVPKVDDQIRLQLCDYYLS